ncbi:MAG TPA: CHAT domain-containing protein [Thermoanaerobaculia bacterium]|nr:CHAT domain-containing protein [Thermoanaerobaculia bacterium]
MAELVRISEDDSFRKSEARLSAPFPHRPPRPVSRGGINELPDVRFVQSLSMLPEREQADAIESVHAMGVARLLSADARGAIRFLTRAAALIESRKGDAVTEARIWNDLAIARFEAAQHGDSIMLVASLDAAERALANAPNVPSIVWTRAVVLDALNLRDRSAAGWRHYLSLDATSPWASEARDRMRESMRQVKDLQACETDDGATVHLRHVETLDARWARDEAWRERVRALRTLGCRSAAPHPAIAIDVATAAIRDGFERAADVILQEVNAEAKRRGQSAWIAKTVTLRGIIRSRVTDPFSAADFDAIRHGASWARKESGTAAQMAAAGPASVSFRGSAAPPSDPNDRPDGIKALSERSGGENAATLSAADASLLAALSEIERQAGSIDDPVERAFLSEQVRSLLLVSVELQLARGRPLAALWFSDRARQVIFRTFGSAGGDSPADLDALGKELIDDLPRDVVVVHQDLRSDALLTWVIRNGHVEFVRTPVSAAILTTEIDSFVSDLRHRNQEVIVPVAQDLYRKILGPVRDRIAGAGTLVYSPAPALRALPVAALHDGQQLMVESHSIVVTRSVGRLSRASFASRAAIGNVLVTLAAPGAASAALEGAQDEVAFVASIHNRRSISSLGSAMTPKEFLAMAPRYDLIHVASHGLVNAQPLQNAIEFGADRVHAHDVTQLRLHRHPIVVLAGCRTDDETSGRATLSLTNAFIAAGASAVVGTLWEIEDRSTATLMKDLHRQLARGISPSEALRYAQQSAARRGDPMSTWAAFQVQM